MKYRELVTIYEQLDATSSTLEKTEILATAFEEADNAHLPVVVKLARGKLFAAWESDDIGVSTSLTKDAIAKATGIDEDQIEDWWRETGDLGNAAAAAVAERTQTTLVSEDLDVLTVHDTLQALASYEGDGSQQRRIDAIAKLLTNADPIEARYIVRTVVGAMRLGVGEGTVRDAIAAAFLDGDEAAVDAVERAHQVTNDFCVVAETARDRGREGLAELDVDLFRPIKVMLAQKAEGIDHGLSEVAETPGDVLWEYKYDGIRTQIHTRGDRTEVYTRRLENVTAQFPEVAEAAQAFLDADEYIVEGEIVGIDPETGRPVPFQQLSKRVKRKYDIEEMQAEIPVVVYLFDVLYVDGESRLETSLRARLDSLEEILDPSGDVLARAANRVGIDAADAATFYQEALDGGQEGLMLKNLGATYQPGSRVGYMMKLKPTMEPLDLVVPRAKWSEGRRSEFLGRVYLACRDAESGEYLEIGRMATGFTDEELAGVTERLEPLILQTEGREVTVEPEVVLGVEYEEIQESPDYGSGFALRFPRFRSFRDDLSPEDVDTLDRVADLYDSQ
jgi:DNA ligase-1